jgi:hypothetical protein
MIGSKEIRIYATIAYADIFDYPLSEEEIRTWMIGKKIHTFAYLPDNKKIQFSQGYYYLRGRKKIISIRKKRQWASKEKWKIVHSVVFWMRFLPAIRLIGVTGGLAMNNTDHRDDIDFFIITKRGMVWTTRFLSTALISFLGRRRQRGSSFVKNKVCLNMFVGEDAMGISKKEQDLFSAHEVLQMVPVWNRGTTYATFLQQNNWVEKYLPEAWAQKRLANMITQKIPYSTPVWIRPIEVICKNLQFWYMKSHKTTEIVTDDVLRFHPQDARVWIKQALQIRLRSWHIPLDKIFYAG